MYTLSTITIQHSLTHMSPLDPRSAELPMYMLVGMYLVRDKCDIYYMTSTRYSIHIINAAGAFTYGKNVTHS